MMGIKIPVCCHILVTSPCLLWQSLSSFQPHIPQLIIYCGVAAAADSLRLTLRFSGADTPSPAPPGHPPSTLRSFIPGHSAHPTSRELPLYSVQCTLYISASKMGPRCNYHEGRAAIRQIRHYANQPARPLWLLRRGPNFTLRDRGVNARLA